MKSYKKNCQGVKVLPVDERSLIGATTLGWVEFMCRYGVEEGQNFDKTWGGLPVVIFFGDDVQLPPVLDSPVYNTSGKTPAALHGALVWKNFNHAVNLQQIVRQAPDQQQLKEVLLALREYKTTFCHANWLHNFQWNNLRLKYGTDFLSRLSENGLFVFPTHEEVWGHNKMKLLEVNETYPVAKSNAISHGIHAKSIDSAKAGGLQKTVCMSKSAKVMLSVNLCVSFGLYNGAIGKIIDIIYLEGNIPENSLPAAVMVGFPNYTGPSFVKDNPKLVPILPVERKLDCSCSFCKRKQIPLKLGWATTIHKCQGMIIGKGESNQYIVINPGTRAFESRNPGALFVALSRAKSAGNDFVDPDFAWHSSVLVNEDRLCHVVKSATVEARTKEMERISSLCVQTKNLFSSLEFDTRLATFINGFLSDGEAIEE